MSSNTLLLQKMSPGMSLLTSNVLSHRSRGVGNKARTGSPQMAETIFTFVSGLLPSTCLVPQLNAHNDGTEFRAVSDSGR